MYDADKRWHELKQTPSIEFHSVEFDTMLNRASSWELPATCTLMVRVFDRNEGTVTEKAFSSEKRLRTFIRKAEEAGMEVTSFDNESMYFSYELAPLFNGDTDAVTGSD